MSVSGETSSIKIDGAKTDQHSEECPRDEKSVRNLRSARILRVLQCKVFIVARPAPESEPPAAARGCIHRFSHPGSCLFSREGRQQPSKMAQSSSLIPTNAFSSGFNPSSEQ